MARREEWHDDYWLLLIQLYLRQPQGVKRLYSRALVDVALELHVHPAQIHRRLFRLRQIDTPRLQRLWDEYAGNPGKLRRVISLLRQMSGFGNARAFYAGVDVGGSWERDFMPIGIGTLTPVKLIMILDLYFRLTPITMAEDTPEVKDLAKLIRETPRQVVEVMDVFLVCDPYISQYASTDSPLLASCADIWKRFGNEDPEMLSTQAAQLTDYFK
ncbi:MAG TPA: hypothetical protein DEQ17_01940 [Prevotella sp.]|nr:hypothetical protein [Prevotella sp.]